MEVNKNMRKQYICPLCGQECEEHYGGTNSVLFKCNNCGEFIIETITGICVLDILTKEEKQILRDYFTNATDDNSLRKHIITKENYKGIIEKCKKGRKNQNEYN